MKKPIQHVQGKHFYTHLVETESLFIELEGVELSQDERSHLASVISANIHQSILNTILSELSPEDKKIFLYHLSLEDHDKIWEHLNEKAVDIEEKIKKAAEELKKSLKKDIEEVKKKQGG